MLRKLFKPPFLHSLLATALITVIAAPNSVAQSSYQDNTPVSTSADARIVAMWAATAEFVYQDDPDLASIKNELQSTIEKRSLNDFGKSIDKAIKLEQQKLHGQNHLVKLKGFFNGIQQQNSGSDNYVALSKAIIGRLDDNEVRMKDHVRRRRLAELEQHLSQLATSATSDELGSNTVSSTLGSTSDNPMKQETAVADGMSSPSSTAVTTSPVSAETPAVTETTDSTSDKGSLIQWLALGLAGLSLAGVIWLITKQSYALVPAVPTPGNDQSRSKSNAPDITWSEMTKYVQRELDKRQV